MSNPEWWGNIFPQKKYRFASVFYKSSETSLFLSYNTICCVCSHPSWVLYIALVGHGGHWGQAQTNMKLQLLLLLWIISFVSHPRFFKYIYWLCYYSCPIPPPHSTPSCPPPPSHMPPLWFMSMGHAYKFFGFYISYTILILPLYIFHLLFMLLILCPFPPSLPLLLPLITLHVSSISVVPFLFWLFA